MFLLSCQIKLRLGSSPLARQMQGLLIWGNISKLESQLRQNSEKDLYFDGRNCSYCVLHVVFNTFETWLISLQIQETTRGCLSIKSEHFYRKDWSLFVFSREVHVGWRCKPKTLIGELEQFEIVYKIVTPRLKNLHFFHPHLLVC